MIVLNDKVVLTYEVPVTEARINNPGENLSTSIYAELRQYSRDALDSATYIDTYKCLRPLIPFYFVSAQNYNMYIRPSLFFFSIFLFVGNLSVRYTKIRDTNRVTIVNEQLDSTLYHHSGFEKPMIRCCICRLSQTR